MLLIAIIYLACAAFVLMQLGKAPVVEDDALPDDEDTRDPAARGQRLDDDSSTSRKNLLRGMERLLAAICGARARLGRH